MKKIFDQLRDEAIAANAKFVQLRDEVRDLVKANLTLREAIHKFDSTFCRKILRHIGDITPARLDKVLTKLAATKQ